MRLATGILATTAFIASAYAKPRVMDSFEDGFFAYTHDQSSPLYQQQSGSMLGDARIVGLSTSRRPTVVSASVVSGSSALRFDTGTGGLGLLDQGELTLTYGGGPFFSPFPPHMLNLDLRGFDAFECDVSSLQGTGEISVAWNSDGRSPSFAPVPLQSPGTLRYSLAQVSSALLADTDGLRISITGLTPDFALTLDEVRLVPEPASAMLFLAGSVMLTRGRATARLGYRPGCALQGAEH